MRCRPGVVIGPVPADTTTRPPAQEPPLGIDVGPSTYVNNTSAAATNVESLEPRDGGRVAEVVTLTKMRVTGCEDSRSSCRVFV